jgi:hypothetical protein
MDKVLVLYLITVSDPPCMTGLRSHGPYTATAANYEGQNRRRFYVLAKDANEAVGIVYDHQRNTNKGCVATVTHIQLIAEPTEPTAVDLLLDSKQFNEPIEDLA